MYLCIIDAIDLRFYEFKGELLGLVGGGNAAIDIGAAALAVASSASGAKEAKTILSGLAGLLLTSRQFFTADVLYNTSIVVALQQMDGDRKQAEAIILQRMQDGSSTTTPGNAGSTPPTKSSTAKVTKGIITKNLTIEVPETATAAASTVIITSTRTIPAPPAAPAKQGAGNQNPAPSGSAKVVPLYTMVEAANDLLAYYEAGTFAHAIVSMNENAGAQATNCKAAVNNVKQTGSKSGTANASDPDTAAAAAAATADSGATPPKTQTPAAQPSGC